MMVSLVFVLFLSACEIEHGEIEPPPKPAPVPAAALWTGGPDGGVFINIVKEKNSTYKGTIYADVTGEVIFAGAFEYTGKQDFDVTDRLSYGGWDGDYLFLRNNEKLIAVHQEK